MYYFLGLGIKPFFFSKPTTQPYIFFSVVFFFFPSGASKSFRVFKPAKQLKIETLGEKLK